MPDTPTPEQPRILIVRLTAIGDVLHGLPVLCALRDRFPGGKIGWIVEGRAGCLLEGHPALDRLFSIPRKWLKSPATVCACGESCTSSALTLPSTSRDWLAVP